MTEELQDQASARGKHPTIDRDIRRLIVSGRWRPGQKIPTWDELEIRFDVARGTIMRAMDGLKQDGFVESRGRRRGMVVAEHPPHLYQYGLILPHWPRAGQRRWPLFCDAVWREAQKIAAAAGRRVKLYSGISEPLDRNEARRLFRDLRGRCLAGMIIDECLAELVDRIVRVARRVPRVAIARPPRLGGMPSVHLRVDLFAQRALDYLLARGRRRVALLVAASRPEDEPTATWRRQIAERGMVTHPGWHLFVPAHLPEWAAHTTRLLMAPDQAQRPDGLIIADDHLVEYATLGVAAAMVSVPRDLDIIAQANYPWPPPAALPVTRLGYDCTAIARTCIESIECQREGRQMPPNIFFPPLFEDEL